MRFNYVLKRNSNKLAVEEFTPEFLEVLFEENTESRRICNLIRLESYRRISGRINYQIGTFMI
jgi:hypothetical protein